MRSSSSIATCLTAASLTAVGLAMTSQAILKDEFSNVDIFWLKTMLQVELSLLF